MIKPITFALTKCLFITAFFTSSPTRTTAASNWLWATPLANKKASAGHAIAVDEDDNTYVTGIYGNKTHQSIGTHLWHSSGGEVLLAKLDSSGKVLWQRFAGGDGIDSGNAVAVFGREAVYVAGYFSGTVKFGGLKLRAAENSKTRAYAPADGFLARFNVDGNVIWVRQFGGVALDQAYAIATDHEGNVYVTGYFQGSATFGSVKLVSRSQPDDYHDPDTRYGDAFVAKYDSRGNALWVRQAGERGMNAGHSIAVDAAGSAYVTGMFDRGSINFDGTLVAATNDSNFIVKYDRDGKVLWAQPTAGMGYYGRANSVAVDDSLNAFVAGSFTFTRNVGPITLSEEPGGNNDVFIAKYSGDGKVLWCKQAGGKSHDTCEGLAVDRFGNAFLTGSFDEKATFGTLEVHAAPHDPRISGYESFLVGYGPSGDVTWTDTIHRNASMNGLTVCKNGDICVIGSFRDPIVFNKTVLKTRTDVWGEPVGDTFVAKYRPRVKN
jgi:hypothetical protein